MTANHDRHEARLGVGGAKLGEATNGVSWSDAIRILRDAADGGVTYFDTADAYTSGTSERLIGRAFRRRRGEVTISTKAGFRFRERSLLEARLRFLAGPVVRRLGQHAVESATAEVGKYEHQDFSPAALERALEGSLRRLGTDHVDVFHVHAPGGAPVDLDGIATLGTGLVDSGKVLRFGVALERAADADPWLELDVVGALQLPFGVLDRSASDVIERARSRGVAVAVRGVLGAGTLLRASDPGSDAERAAQIDDLRALAAERSIDLEQLAIAYAAGQPGVEVVLVGVRLRRHLDALLAAVPFARPDADLVDAVDAVCRRHEPSAGGSAT